MSAGREADVPIARWWRPEEGGRVLCTLCPRYCRIGQGQAGFCYIRRNEGGTLLQTAYGTSTGFAVDPIEKKPLNHFFPGSDILSFGTAGCNLGCRFCQNWSISKARLDQKASARLGPEEVVALAVEQGAPAIAYTYNDPVIWAEFVIDVCREARGAGLRNVLVTAGYVTEEARGDLFRHVDGVNVDLKAFTDDFYRKVTLSRIAPVQETLRWLVHETDVWTEVTTLLIPGLNDSDEEIRAECEWIARELGTAVPLHFTAFHPDFKMLDRPRTPAGTLRRARKIAQDVGLEFVYVGNVHDAEGQTTRCPKCRALLIERDWHAVTRYELVDNHCPQCGEEIPGRFDAGPTRPTRNRRRLLGLL